MSRRSKRLMAARGGQKLAAGTAIPPKANAPAPTPPVAMLPSSRAIAPTPLTDRYPTVIGQSLSLSYLSSVARLATTGYRQQFVDLLNELLEQDPNLYSVVTKRICSVANGRVEIVACDLPEGDPDTKAAGELAQFVQKEIGRVADLSQSIYVLLWAIYYGITAAEIFWSVDADGWHIDRLGFIHSRRLSYPDSQSWSLYVWDQGQVYGWDYPWNETPTNSGIYGLRVADFPGKFIVYAPQLRGDHPTREGVGRETATWSILKRIGARGAADYLERFAKPMMDVSYATGDEGKPREAQDEDIELASSIAAKLGAGSGSYAAHADSIKIEPKAADGSSSSKITYAEWIGICNAEESKAVLGGTLGTDVGKGGGNRALGEVQERGEVDLEQLDATTLGEAIRRDIVMWLVRLNRPELLHLCPKVIVHVDTDPDPKSVVELVEKLTNVGAPVDLEKVSDETGIPLVPNKPGPDGKVVPRRSFKSDVADPMAVDSDLMSAEAKEQAQQATEAQQAIAMAKATTPQPKPGEEGAGDDGKGKPSKGKPAPKKTPVSGSKGKPASKANLTDTDLAEAAIAIVRDRLGRVLTVSRPEGTREQSIPGGTVDPGETPIETAIRELREETAIEIEELRHAAVVRSPSDGRTVHVFVVDAWSGTPTAAEPDTEIAWLAPSALLDTARLFRPTVRELMAAGLFDTAGAP